MHQQFLSRSTDTGMTSACFTKNTPTVPPGEIQIWRAGERHVKQLAVSARQENSPQ